MSDANEENKLQAATVVLDLEVHKPGTTRRGDMSAVETDADKTLLRVSKRIVDSEHYRAACEAARTCKDYLAARALPSQFRPGMYLLPVGCLEACIKRVQEAIAEFDAAADAFVAEYPAKKAEYMQRLASQANDLDYPEQGALRAAFRIDYRLLTLHTPGSQKLGDALYSIEKAKAESMWEQNAQDVRVALATGLQRVVEKLAGMLGGHADGTKGVLTDAGYHAVTEFLDLFGERNVLKDDATEVLVTKARALLDGNDAESLRKDKEWRAVLAEQASKLADEVEAHIESVQKVTRRFVFEE